jgi:hypothetical protein
MNKIILLLTTALLLLVGEVIANQPNATLTLGNSITNTLNGNCFYYYVDLSSFAPYKPMISTELSGPSGSTAVSVQSSTILDSSSGSGNLLLVSKGPSHSPVVSYTCPEGINSNVLQEISVCPMDYLNPVEYTIKVDAYQSILQLLNDTTTAIVTGTIPEEHEYFPRIFYYVEIKEDMLLEPTVLRIHGSFTVPAFGNSVTDLSVRFYDCPTSTAYDFQEELKTDSSWTVIEIRSDATTTQKLVAGRYYMTFDGSDSTIGKNFALGACLGEGCTPGQAPIDGTTGDEPSLPSAATSTIPWFALTSSLFVSSLLLMV